MRPKKTIPLVGSPGSIKTESFKRPNHPDFMDANELKKIEFTGIRQNNLGLQWEFWILGSIEKTVTFQAVALDPLALTKAHMEIFHMAADPNSFKRGN
jgi:hypothetical protein